MLSAQAFDAAWKAGEIAADCASPANYLEIANVHARVFMRRLQKRRSALSRRDVRDMGTAYVDVFMESAFSRAQREAERMGDTVRLTEVRLFYWVRRLLLGC